MVAGDALMFMEAAALMSRIQICLSFSELMIMVIITRVKDVEGQIRRVRERQGFRLETGNERNRFV
jgi:hypothetical protein